MTYPELVGIVVLGLSTLASGLAIALRSHARLSGIAMALGGAVLIGAALVYRADQGDLPSVLFTIAGGLLLPVALATYPRVRFRHPVDLVSLVVIAGSGTLAVTSFAWAGPSEQDGVLSFAGVVTGTVIVLHTWWRIERSEDSDRRALVWMSLSLAVVGSIFFFTVFAVDGVSEEPTAVGAAFGACYALIGLVGPAMYVGLQRAEVVDVRGLVVQVFVLLTAVTCYLAVYAMVEGVLELLGGEPPSVGTMGLAAALTAAGFHPLQVGLRGVIDQLLFGTRPDPLGAAGHVAEGIGDDPELALRAIREALVLPYAELRVEGAVLATSGTAVTHTRSLPLALGDNRAGELVVGLRAGDLRLSSSDGHVLDLARPLLAQSLRARMLADDLQESREQTISALEEERRRLRRDLHDGLGPRLSGIAFTSDAAGNRIREDPEGAAALLRSVRAETVAAIQEIRELVYGMRPPALDELGLVAALRQQASTLRTTDGRPMDVTIEAGDLPTLSAAVEVAAYRIAVEALTNASRHSGSDVAVARLCVDGGLLVVEVLDRGASAGTWRAGVGLSSMRERTAELGGSLEAGCVDGGGRVLGRLPL